MGGRPAGTNCGRKTSRKIADFALVAAERSPIANDLPPAGSVSGPRAVAGRKDSHIVQAPQNSSTAAPVICTATNRPGLVRSSSETPVMARHTCPTPPVIMPAAAASAGARRAERSTVWVMSAASCPGVTITTSELTRNNMLIMMWAASRNPAGARKLRPGVRTSRRAAGRTRRTHGGRWSSRLSWPSQKLMGGKGFLGAGHVQDAGGPERPYGGPADVRVAARLGVDVGDEGLRGRTLPTGHEQRDTDRLDIPRQACLYQ